MPLESTETSNDWDLFEPKPRMPAQQSSRKRKRDGGNGISQNGVNGHDYAESTGEKDAVPADPANLEAEIGGNDRIPLKLAEHGAGHQALPESALGNKIASHEESTINGIHKNDHAPRSKNTAEIISDDSRNPEEQQEVSTKTETHIDAEEQGDEGESEDEAQPQPTRRITRALAAENNGSRAATPPLSPNSTTSSIESYLLQPDPLFLLPPILAANHRAPRSLLRLGIPVDELMETRRLLTMYIQKQEESVRGCEAVLGKLIKAKRMRDQVLEWAKAEGHVGELSDGEDWIDANAWGLQAEDLKKGTDEENNETQEDTGRKGKRRRRD